ncbi:MAG: DUF4145 domain-containing protein [Verrucomicrobiota bacterium]
MKCSHCLTSFHDNEVLNCLGNDPDGYWGVGIRRCSACEKLIIRLFSAEQYYSNINTFSGEKLTYLIRPKISGRSPVPKEVPKEYADDYTEACLVLGDSAKASAALSRRCLQHVLRGEAQVKHQDLAREIQEVLNRNMLPSHIADSLDAVRNIGNFAAHPMKSQATGEVVPVEPGEAEWTLDTLEELFDFYFVSPARTKARRDALNKKLTDAGKPPMK